VIRQRLASAGRPLAARRRAACAARRRKWRAPDLHDVVCLERGAVVLAVADAQRDGRVVGVDLAALRVVEAAQRHLRGRADAGSVRRV
jgi:hypothetical protein